MLLRNSSTPILNSWLHQSKSSPSESDQFLPFRRTKSLSLTPSFHPPPSLSNDSVKRVTQNLLELDITDPRKKIPVPKSWKFQPEVKSKENGVSVRDQDLRPTSDSPSSSIPGEFLNSGLGLKVPNDEVRDECVLQMLVVDGGTGSDGGRVCGGGGGGSGGRGSNGGGGGDSDKSGFNNSTDAYYQKMIEANPDNALLLGNYAKFLKKVP